MKKILLSIGLAVGLVSGALADSQTWVIAGNTTTNVLPAPIKLLSAVLTATNATTVTFYDAPGSVWTNIVPAFTNYSQYATNVSQIYTDFFGKPTTNWLTNALVRLTNSSASPTVNTYAQVFTQGLLSNTVNTLPNMGLTFVNGVLVTNGSANTLTITLNYTGQ